MHRLFAPFVLLASLFHFSHSDSAYTKMVDKVSSSVVRITGMMEEDGEVKPHTCSGFIISKNVVLTADHCIGDQMKVDGVQPKVVKRDAYYDLALLTVSSDKDALPFRYSDVNRFEYVTAVGYAYGWTRLSVLRVRVFLIDWAVQGNVAPGLVMQGSLIGGMSGGPIIDEDGSVVAITQRTNEGVSYGVGVLLIRAFLVGV